MLALDHCSKDAAKHCAGNCALDRAHAADNRTLLKNTPERCRYLPRHLKPNMRL